MNEQEFKKLTQRVTELEKKQDGRTRQQITYPVDNLSLTVLAKYALVRTFHNLTGYLLESFGFSNVTIAGTVGRDATDRVYRAAVSVGEETMQQQGSASGSKNTQIYLEDQADSSTFNSFLYGYRKPLYTVNEGSTVSVTSGASTMTDSDKDWDTNELAGAMINIYDSGGALQFSRQIASNTGTVVTIDGTWPATVNSGSYVVLMPIYLGAAEYPWRQGYFGGDDVSSGGTGAQRRFIRIGYGSTGGTETRGLFFGTGSPESVVTASVGSLYLRTDGSTNTVLYVKESGTGNTGWVVQLSGTNISSSAVIKTGTGTPEGAVTGTVGNLFLRTDGGATTTLYVKTSGTGNTGWTAK